MSGFRVSRILTRFLAVFKKENKLGLSNPEELNQLRENTFTCNLAGNRLKLSMKFRFFKKKEKKPREVSLFREYFEMISEVLIYVFFVMTFLLQSFVIPTGSMEKTLLIGDHLFVDKVSFSRWILPFEKYILPRKEIKRGTIITFKAPNDLTKEYVKRVVGLPGEKIKIENKKVFINGRELKENYVQFTDPDNFSVIRDNFFEFTIPENTYFCLGDNRDNSLDSRFWGPLPKRYIIGRPWRIYWSYKSDSSEYLTPGVVNKIKDIFNTLINFFTKTRWERTFKSAS